MAEEVAQPLLDDAPVGSLPKAIIAGVIAALIGAAIWAGIEMMTGYQIGWIAIGIGFLCGFAVKFAGKGETTQFRIVGAACAFVGCFLGTLWAFDHELTKMLAKENIDVQLSWMNKAQLMVENVPFMTWVIMAIAVWEGWKFSVQDG